MCDELRRGGPVSWPTFGARLACRSALGWNRADPSQQIRVMTYDDDRVRRTKGAVLEVAPIYRSALPLKFGWVLGLVCPVLGCIQPTVRSVPGDATVVARGEAVRWGLASMEYGQQFIVVCDDQKSSRFPYPGPGCSQVAGMSFDIHRDNWSSNYLNYDDPQDPANAGLLSRQGYISLQLADLAGYKALALLEAHRATGNPSYLERFRRTFLRQLLDKQLPSAALKLGATQTFQAAFQPSAQRDVTMDATGAFANSATLAAGPDGVLGTLDDVLAWHWNGSAPFQFAALAEALAMYAQTASDPEVLNAVTHAGQFLLRLERRAPTGDGEGNWAYAVAPADGPPNRMTTSLVALALLRLAAVRSLPGAPEFHAAVQRATAWLRQQPALELDPVSAGAEIQVLLASGEAAAATATADALLARMTTPASLSWGDHRYAGDPHAVGGIASPWESGSFQSTWFATYNVAGLLTIGRATGTGRYLTAADLLIRWLGDKLARSQREAEIVHVQDLRGGVTRIDGGTWWGLYPELYEPNVGSYEDASHVVHETLPSLILGWVHTSSIDLAKRPPSWLEQQGKLDFERLLYDRVRADPYYAHISQPYPWQGFRPLPRNLGDVSPAINPLLADDAALALLDYAILR